MTISHVVLANSFRPPSRTAKRVRAVDPHSRVEVTVTIRGPALPSPDIVMAHALTPAELAEQYGAQHDADKVAKVLRGFGLTIDAITQAGRSLRVSGPASAFEAAFHPNLGIYEDRSHGDFRGREGELQVPAELDGVITGVLGLDQRRVARRKATATGAAAQLVPLTPAQLEQRYQFPAGTASGQVVAIAEFGQAQDDGSVVPPVYIPEEVDAFCRRHGRPPPRIQVVPVNLAPLTLADFQDLPPAQRSIATDEAVEVMMDVQIAAALCPEATLLVLFASFDQKGWVDLLDTATGGEHGLPVALSVSWGLAEDSPDWSAGAIAAISERLQIAAMLGITICASSGDDGASDGIADSRGHVDFPGSSPFALCVGGTQLAEAGGAEVAWWEPPGCRTPTGGGATGGGVSTRFARPAWQAVTVASINAGAIDGRVVPDVGALAGTPYYDLLFGGRDAPNGGTSASTPLWASLIARINAALPAGKRQRFLTPLLYATAPGDTAAMAASGCRPITSGHNASYPSPGSGYKCQAGYSAVTGWGVPNGLALLEHLRR